ncbi:PEGA domain-containing protein [Thermococcus celericrescens]|uniref:PEGA domain-containing protein n=1 Tax=Thermococcus celericrescens TaxID=227598 RepID=UPI00373FC6AB
MSVLLAPNESRVLKIGLKPLPVLSVTTEPPGALVSVGNETCRSPCRLALEPGRHTVETSLEGYLTRAGPFI